MATNTHPLRDILTGIQDPNAAVTIHSDAQSDTTTITHVTIDSRLVEPGALYVALVGMTVDGHDYVAAAAAAGAGAARVSHIKAPELARANGWSVVSVGAQPPAHWDGLLLIAVPDPLAALQRWATWHRLRYNPPFVVGITGSVGKTSTKEFIGAILNDAMPTLR
ncbi:MAG: Mur ligase domain-containing protein, partial [Roseiflexaceae bacterium]